MRHAGPPTSYAVRGDRAFLRAQTATALLRLRVERLDLLQLHRLDPEVPVPLLPTRRVRRPPATRP